MRVVGGQLRGRRIVAPGGHGTRPTSDRVREALFSIIESRFGPLDGFSVLDLFAGSGALGIEALSRGASWATFVESDGAAAAAIAANVQGLGLADRCAVVRRDALRLDCARLPGRPFSLLLADPPYRIEPHEVLGALERLAGSGCLVPGAPVVYETASSAELSWPDAFEPVVEKRYGSTRLAMARWRGSVSP